MPGANTATGAAPGGCWALRPARGAGDGSANSTLYEEAPGRIEAFRARGDEIAGHGRTNAGRHGVPSEAEEGRLIEEATRVPTPQEGWAPKG